MYGVTYEPETYGSVVYGLGARSMTDHPVTSPAHEVAVLLALHSGWAHGLKLRRILEHGQPSAALHLDSPDNPAWCVTIVVEPPVMDETA